MNINNMIQHIQYLPFGEIFVSQRNDWFDSRYKFTAKEHDNETNYTYFGARYYDSDLSSWLSVDPLASKYPSLSPYNYCANNPVILVDPDGRDIVPTNAAGDRAVNTFIGRFSEKTLKKAFGYKVQTGTGGMNPVYSSYHNTPDSPKEFKKNLRKDADKMTDNEIDEAYAFYLALTDKGQHKVEGWNVQDNFTNNTNTFGSFNVDDVPNYSSRDVKKNKFLDDAIGLEPNNQNFNQIFNPKAFNDRTRKNKCNFGYLYLINYGTNNNKSNDTKVFLYLI